MKRLVLTAVTFCIGVLLVSSLTAEGVVFGLPLVLLSVVVSVKSLSQTLWDVVWRTA
ncbi:hypothetical protein SAMN04487950_3601 [Halogranum rubrum]|uniref:Uncharacterized protein n=2 Tax=Halogranum rubrum TaxID=553466 RepID=A0A1I4HBG1_9EURY|nr:MULTISPECIES: hypothetical protein [Halogranum]EJN59983.1 hypothetical protein HSB1_21410 [Halogranum salarium B-1]SFL39100.1 hypothetical protein SAMN04487950_3601 [Halogranum rubrum]